MGKTTVAHELASKFNALHIDLADLVIKEQLSTGLDKTRDTLIGDIPRISERVQQIMAQLQKDRTVIIDGHYSQDVIPAKNITTVFVLRRDPRELKDLMQARGFRNSKLWENLAAEILDVVLFDVITACGADRVCEIDVTGKKQERVVEEMVRILEKKGECRLGIVDWLGLLEQEKCLDEFLKHI